MTPEGNVPSLFPTPDRREGNRKIAGRCSGNTLCSLRSLLSLPRCPVHAVFAAIYYTLSWNKGNKGNNGPSKPSRLAVFLFPSQSWPVGNKGNSVVGGGRNE